MMVRCWLSAATWLGLVGAAASTAQAVPPPPVVDQPSRPQRNVETWTPGTVRCEGGVTVADGLLRRPMTRLSWSNGLDAPVTPRDVTLEFDIDATGRPVSIRDRRSPGDFGPSLAASTFPAAAHRGCSVTYTASVQPVGSASVDALVSYTVSPMSGPLPPEGWARLQVEGDCTRAPRPQPLMRAYPDFRRIAGTPGVKDWARVAYDIDARGKAIHVRPLQRNGNAELEAAAVKAVRNSRFAGGARTGCAYQYWHAPDVLPAPQMPDTSAFAVEGAVCPADRKWTAPAGRRYPTGYSARRIEGWAIVRYDIAPWGEVGNVTVLAAQPSEQFGVQAVENLQAAKFAPSPQGASGCVERMRFAMPADGGDDASAAAAGTRAE